MLKLTNVVGGYRDAVTVLNSVNLDMADWPIVGVLGSNGAGKTTLLRSICNMLPRRSGGIAFDGTDLTRLPTHQIAHHGIRMVPEGRGTLVSLNVIDNLRVGGHGYPMTDVAERVERELDRFPRLRERAHERAGMLSGGEQQMLAIGRAMMGNPRLLIMDEPSQGLAPIIVDQIFELIETLAANGTRILLVEQDVGRGLEVSGYAYVLAKGEVVLEGTGAELAEDDYVKEVLLGI
ncbi:MAG: ABC transporter ATP-binding protein [Roseovarius sp.]